MHFGAGRDWELRRCCSMCILSPRRMRGLVQCKRWRSHLDFLMGRSSGTSRNLCEMMKTRFFCAVMGLMMRLLFLRRSVGVHDVNGGNGTTCVAGDAVLIRSSPLGILVLIYLSQICCH